MNFTKCYLALTIIAPLYAMRLEDSLIRTPAEQLLHAYELPQGKETLKRKLETTLDAIPTISGCESTIAKTLLLNELVKISYKKQEAAAQVLDLCLSTIDEKKGRSIKIGVVNDKIGISNYYIFETLLINAVHANNVPCAKVLLEHNANPNTYIERRTTEDYQFHFLAPLTDGTPDKLALLLISYGAKLCMQSFYRQRVGEPYVQIIEQKDFPRRLRILIYHAAFQEKKAFLAILQTELHKELLKFMDA